MQKCIGAKLMQSRWCRGEAGAGVQVPKCRRAEMEQRSEVLVQRAEVLVRVPQRCRGGAGGAGGEELVQRCCRVAAELLNDAEQLVQRWCRGGQ